MKNNTQETLNVALSDVETHKHIGRVRHFINIFVKDLIDRADKHDQSKFESPEREIFGANFTKLKTTGFGTPEYKALLEEVKPALDSHYSKNRHHPEWHKKGIEGMTILDLCEMLADWRAATERHKSGNIRQSLDYNSEKFNMTPQLKVIFENTIREYFD